METTLLKGLRLLEELVHSEKAIGVSELAGRLETSKSNVHRTLSTLVYAGYVEQNEHGSYQPTLKVWEQGMHVIARHPVRRAAMAFMATLQKETSETVNLAILEGFESLYIHQITAHIPIRPCSTVGSRTPAIYPASGKILLAFQTNIEEQIKDYVREQNSKNTSKPQIDVDGFFDELATIRQTRCAMSVSGWRDGINSVASAIIGRDGLPLGAIAVSGPQERMSRERMQEIFSSVLNACTQTAATLGV